MKENQVFPEDCWAMEILGEASHLSHHQIPPPPYPVQDWEHPVGFASPLVRQLYGLSLQYGLESASLDAYLQTAQLSSEESLPPTLLSQEARVKRDCIMDLAFGQLRHDVQLWHRTHVGLRDNWVVVWFDPKDCPGGAWDEENRGDDEEEEE